MLQRLAAVCFGLGTALAGLSAQGASFDCGKAATRDERAVCSDPTLSRLDTALATAYSDARAKFGEEVSQLDRDFLDDRKGCADAKPCLTAAYVGVLQRFHNYGSRTGVPAGVTAAAIAGGGASPSSSLPATLGACSTTSITEIGPRLTSGNGAAEPEDFDSGTHVSFANKGYQVSYEREAAIIASKPHDAVTMCLVSIPHHCPKDDDRGRFYLVTNRRTGQTWTLPDSQHMCGGA